MTHKRKQIILDFLKIEIFFSLKDNAKELKKQAIGCDKIFANIL